LYVVFSYIDEDVGKEVKDRTPKSSTGTAYVYVNEITSTRIYATNNKESYKESSSRQLEKSMLKRK
jgi:hypothetical protein